MDSSRFTHFFDQGTTKLPAWGDMWSDIRRREAEMAQQYVASRRHTIQVDYMGFMDELAQLVGCAPDFGENTNLTGN